MTSVRIQERSQSVVIYYSGKRDDIISALENFSYGEAHVPEDYLRNSGRQLNRQYWDKLLTHILRKCVNRLFLPYQLRAVIAVLKSIKIYQIGVTGAYERQNRGACAGCYRHRSLDDTGGFQNCRFYYVLVGNRGDP